MTARDICTTALNYLGIVAANETPDAPDINRAFDDLNDLLDSWSNDSYMLYANQDDTFTLVPAQGTYSIGSSGADFTMVRPTQVQFARVRINNVDYTLTEMNNAEYEAIGMKSITSTIPNYYYYDPTYPNASLKLWPVPATAIPITITSLTQFTRFASLDTAVSLPPGYARAIKWNLVKEIADAFGKTPTDSVIRKAAESKAALKVTNNPDLRMTFDPMLGSRPGAYNIYRDGMR